MAQRLMELAVLSFVCLHPRAKSPCAILINLILTWESGMLYFYSYNMLIDCSFSVHVVKWVTENNCPVNIINDRELRKMLTVGRSRIELPSPTTISRDIKACFCVSRDHITKLLRVRSHVDVFLLTLELTPYCL